MKRIEFNANDADMTRLEALKEKNKTSFTALIREAIKLLHEKEITNVLKTLLVVCLCISVIACAMPMVHAFQQQPQGGNALFKGRYWFHSRGTDNMHESGVMIADGNGHFTLHSMYISDHANGSVNTVGHYSLTAYGAGTAKQGACLATDLNCSPVDFESLWVSSDGAFGMMVSMEGPGAGWALEMQRDPMPFTGDLTNCDARTGSVLNCNDLWVWPVPWK